VIDEGPQAPADLDPGTVLAFPPRRLSFSDLQQGQWQVIDVRSAAEFSAGSVPGAVNIPLFDDEERGMIGTIYRQGGREQAVELGHSVAGAKLADLLAAFLPHRHRPLAVYCARGGMRSRAVVNLLIQAGFAAVQLEGGYKAYRNRTLDRLKDFRPQLIVIHGLTGTGKTRILQHLTPAIDLEELAGHRSSLFGALNLQPSSQQNFESRLVAVISGLGEEPLFIEGESRKIGRVFIPNRLIEDYPVEDEVMLSQIEAILRSLKQKLGTVLVEEMCRLLHRRQLADLVKILLLEYYDRRYRRGMADYRYHLELSSENIPEAARRLSCFREELRSTRRR